MPESPGALDPGQVGLVLVFAVSHWCPQCRDPTFGAALSSRISVMT